MPSTPLRCGGPQLAVRPGRKHCAVTARPSQLTVLFWAVFVTLCVANSTKERRTPLAVARSNTGLAKTASACGGKGSPRGLMHAKTNTTAFTTLAAARGSGQNPQQQQQQNWMQQRGKQQPSARSRLPGALWVVLVPTVMMVLLLTAYYQHLLTATAANSNSTGCAVARLVLCHHHPLLPHSSSAAGCAASGSMQQGDIEAHAVDKCRARAALAAAAAAANAHQHSHLTATQYPAVAASRAALQAYLSSAEFAAVNALVTSGQAGAAALASGGSAGASAAKQPVGPQAAATPPGSWQSVAQSGGSGCDEGSRSAGSTHSISISSSSSSSTSSWQRGILVVAGGRKLLTHLVVLLKVLRETLGCTLPVEVAWQGAAEMDHRTLSMLQQRFGPLRGFDVQAMPYPPHMRRVPLTRWVGKVAALLHCNFSEVLLLDSDNLPLRDPAYLFADPLYRQQGNLFWPDYWGNWVKPGVYPWLGLNSSLGQPQLTAGAGCTGRDAESGMLLLDRRRWLGVLHWTFWVNTWHKQLYYHVLHGDKDTFALGFALAGQADKYRQVSVVPGGVFRWGEGQLEVKATASTSAHNIDGWQLLGALQYDDAGRPAFFHRTMNKLSPDEEPWPAELITGPLPTRWLDYYLAHDSKGPTKGVWWEHVAPAAAFQLTPSGRQHSTLTDSNDGSGKAAASNPGSTAGRVGPTGDSCKQLLPLYLAARQAGLPVEVAADLECWAAYHSRAQHAGLARPDVLPSAPVAAARVTAGFVRLSRTPQVINASVAALAWLKGPEGAAAFPSLARGSSMP